MSPAPSGAVRPLRNSWIDMLRGVSILLVMVLHYNLAYRLVSSPLAAWVSVPTLRALFYNGNYGVSIFFVISGFLITSTMISRYGALGDVAVGHFYKLRFFRLYPLVVVALLVIALMGAAGFGHFTNRINDESPGVCFALLANFSVLTFWHNVLMAYRGYFNYAMNIYWSLSVEEVFYLGYPIVLLALRRRWQLVALAAFCFVAGPAYRYVHRDDELLYLYGNVACVDMLAYGCAAAVVARRVVASAVVRSGCAIAACVAMGWVYMQGIDGHEALGATGVGMAAAIFLVSVSSLPAGPSVRRWTAPLAWLGARSYELYLFHIIVLGIMVDLLPRTAMSVSAKLPMLAVFLLLSSALAWAMARCVGDPLNRWLRRRFASDTQASAHHARVASPSPVGVAPHE